MIQKVISEKIRVKVSADPPYKNATFSWSCLLALSVGMAALPAAPPRSRTFTIRYEALVTKLPVAARAVDLWLPAPRSDSYQQISDLRVTAPAPYQMRRDAQNNLVLYLRVAGTPPPEVRVVMTFRVRREEHRQERLTQPRFGDVSTAPPLDAYLRPDRLVPLDATIRSWARDVVERVPARTDLEQARAIYNHVIATVKYEKTGLGWGRGDLYYACEQRRGNCTDFHAIFIGYCRALGIPARFAIGLPVPPDRASGSIEGYHCWAEFYARGIGWVPIDASEGAKHPAKREYFFGAHDEHRVEFTTGRDLLLTPPQRGDPLNYFIYPYVEVDGTPHKEVVTTVRFENVR